MQAHTPQNKKPKQGIKFSDNFSPTVTNTTIWHCDFQQ
jgi:hypothetical protein